MAGYSLSVPFRYISLRSTFGCGLWGVCYVEALRSGVVSFRCVPLLDAVLGSRGGTASIANPTQSLAWCRRSHPPFSPHSYTASPLRRTPSATIFSRVNVLETITHAHFCRNPHVPPIESFHVTEESDRTFLWTKTHRSGL